MKNISKIFLFIVILSLSLTTNGEDKININFISEPGQITEIVKIDSDGKTERYYEIAPPSEKMVKAKAQYLEGQELHKLTVKVDGKSSNVNAFGIFVFKDNDIFWSQINQDSYVFNLPNGKYLVQGVVGNNSAIIFMPDVLIEGDTEINLNSSDATTFIIPDLILPDGNRGIPGENLIQLNGKSILKYDNLGQYTLSYMLGGGSSDWNLTAGIYTNCPKTHANYNFLMMGYDKGNANAYSVFLTENGENLENWETISNDPTQFHDYDVTFKRSPIYTESESNYNGNSFSHLMFVPNGEFMGGMSFLSPVIKSNLHVYMPTLDFSNFYSLIEYGDTDYIDPESPTNMYGISSPLFAWTPEGFKFYSNQYDNLYSYPSQPGLRRYPINYSFSFLEDEKIIMGEGTPICIFYQGNILMNNKEYHYLYPLKYYGNFGERRNTDTVLSSTEIYYNGDFVTTLKSSPILYGPIRDWYIKWLSKGYKPGKMEYRFINTNIEIDGMPGSSVCSTIYDENNEDQMPPVLQRLMIRDSEGNPSIRLEDPKGSKITLAGGDFEFSSEEYYGNEYTIINFEKADVKVEYAAHGTEDFQEIPMTEDPEKFLMPGYGAYYEGSLDEITTVSETGWFDLRITLTDAAGNSQTQTLSPYFYIASLSGVSVPEADSFETENIEIYDLQGRRVSEKNISPGIYISRKGNKVSKIIITER